MKPFRAIKTVYSYYLPEVRALIDSLTRRFPHEVFLRSVDPGLDRFEQPIIDKLLRVHARDVPGLKGFPCRYSTAGSEEGIREYMSALAAGGAKRIYMLEGDYEGYRETANTRGIKTVEVRWDLDPAALAPGPWFLSNPSASSGNLLPPEIVSRILESGHRVFYDLSYLGSTGPAVFDLSHPNIAAAAISFSKPYGLFYYRVGFLFSRQAVPSLYANKWFKNIFGLLIAEKILDEIKLQAIAKKYKEIQSRIVDGIRSDLGLDLEPSDSFLLAHLPQAGGARLEARQRRLIEGFRRGRNYRFCLTPFFQEREKGPGA